MTGPFGGSRGTGPDLTGVPDLKACRRGAEWALVAAVAQHLRLFDALAGGPREEAALARELDLDARATRILLGALVDLGLVREDGEGFRLTGHGRARFVDRDTPDFEADATRQWRANIRRWVLELERVARTGKPADESPLPVGTGAGDAGEEDEEASLARFMAAMANKPPEQVAAVESVCRARLEEAGIEPATARALDLGGGPGSFARAFAAWGGEVVLADRPEVIEHVRRAYELDRVPNLELWAGDFLHQLPPGPFDLVLVANITHIYDPPTNARLLQRIAAVNAPGGIVALLDFVRGVSEFASLFAITMLLNTEAGNTYARADYEAWLEGAGYGDLRLVSLDPDRQLITALRRTPGRRAG